MTDGKSLSIIIYISLTLVYEEIDETLQVISIETKWQMVSLFQLLYFSLTLVYEEVGDTLQVISIEAEWLTICHSASILITCRVSSTSSYTNVKLIYIITDNDLPSVILSLY